MLDSTQKSDLGSGWLLNNEAQGVEAQIPDPAVAYGHAMDQLGGSDTPPGYANTDYTGKDQEDMIQLAGLGSMIKGALRRSTRDIKERGDVQPEVRLKREQIKGVIDSLPDTLDKTIDMGPSHPYIETGTINVTRHHPGAEAQSYQDLYKYAKGDPAGMLNAVENAEDLAKMLDGIGKGMDLTAEPRTHDSIRGKSKAQIIEELEPFLLGKKPGLLNDSQLYGLRSMVASVGEQTIALARTIKAGDESVETALKYKLNAESLIALQAMLTGQVREVARALSQQRMVAGVLDKPTMQALQLSMTQAGTDHTALKMNALALLARLEAGDSPEKALAIVKDRFSKTDAAIEFYKANLLSAIPTHVLNPGTSSMVHLHETFVLKPIAASIGIAKEKVGIQSADRVHFAEVGASIAGSVAGARDGLMSAMRIIGDPAFDGEFAAGGRFEGSPSGSAVIEKGGDIAEGAGMPRRAGEWAGAALTPGLRLIRAEDELVKTLAYRSELSALAMRDGLTRGLQGDELSRHFESLLDQPSEILHSQALQYADRVTFQDKNIGGVIGILANSLMRGVADIPVLQLVFPFIRTNANIAEYFLQSSPFAPLTKKFRGEWEAGGARADMAIAQVIGGMGITTMAYMLYQSGLLTGGGPDNLEQRAALEKTGWRPHQIRIPGTDQAFTWDRATPFALHMAYVVDALDKARFARRDVDAVNFVMDSALSTGQLFMEQTFAKEAYRFLQLFMGNEHVGVGMGRFIGTTLNGFVPWSAQLASIGRATEDVKHAPSVPKGLGLGGEGSLSDMQQIVGQTMEARLPGMRDNLRPARFWDGSPMIPEAGGFIRWTLPTELTEIHKDAASIALAKDGIKVAAPKSLISVGRVNIELIDFDGGKGLVYDAYVKDVGEQRRAAVLEVMGSGDYKNAQGGVNSERALMLEKAISAGYKAGAGKFFDETLPAMVRSKKADLKDIAVKMGTSPDALIQSMRDGAIAPTKDLRFDAKGAPGKREINLPEFSF